MSIYLQYLHHYNPWENKLLLIINHQKHQRFTLKSKTSGLRLCKHGTYCNCYFVESLTPIFCLPGFRHAYSESTLILGEFCWVMSRCTFADSNLLFKTPTLLLWLCSWQPLQIPPKIGVSGDAFNHVLLLPLFFYDLKKYSFHWKIISFLMRFQS